MPLARRRSFFANAGPLAVAGQVRADWTQV